MTVALYTDQGPPLRVQGYACAFGKPYWLADDQVWESVEPGAFDLTSPRPVPVLFAHLPGRQYSPRAILWQDEHGLAFEFDVPSSWVGMQLAQSIRRGNIRQASVCFAAGGRRVRRRVVAGVETDVVIGARLSEISMVNTAANPWSSVWLDDETGDELGGELATDRARWILGRQRARLVAGRPQGRARRGKPQVPPAILKLLDEGRPSGWLSEPPPGLRPMR